MLQTTRGVQDMHVECPVKNIENVDFGFEPRRSANWPYKPPVNQQIVVAWKLFLLVLFAILVSLVLTFTGRYWFGAKDVAGESSILNNFSMNLSSEL